MRIVVLFLLIFSVPIAYSQLGFLEGTWQGIITTYNQSPKDGNAVWFDFHIDANSGDLKGESRVETPFTNFFAYKNFKGKVESRNVLSFEEIFIGLQKNTGREIWCLNQGTLKYNDSTGYLKGKWTSSDCRRLSGEIVLYRSKHQMSKSDTLSLYHSWFNNMVTDLSKGWKAYYVRDSEMRNFEFKPVYFDHDKDDLKVLYEDYLRHIARIVNSHSDLRIKIIGHTDSNGTDDYNVGLSERRAERVKKFLIQADVPADKVVIEYRGELDPATTNATSEGKRLNRRVDFEFI